MARSSTTFKKGQSGNPSGRPKVIVHVRDIARQYTEEAIEALVSFMRNALEHPSARVSAAKELLDRGYGKAPMMVTGDEEQFRKAMDDLTDDELDAIIERGRRKGILPGGPEVASEDPS